MKFATTMTKKTSEIHNRYVLTKKDMGRLVLYHNPVSHKSYRGTIYSLGHCIEILIKKSNGRVEKRCCEPQYVTVIQEIEDIDE